MSVYELAALRRRVADLEGVISDTLRYVQSEKFKTDGYVNVKDIELRLKEA